MPSGKKISGWLLASHPELLTPVLDVVHRAISGWLIKKSGLKRAEGQAGGVTFVQCFGSALNLNIHLQGQMFLEGEMEEGALSALQAAATSYRIGLGPRWGKKVLTPHAVEADEGRGSERRVQNNGFSLHAEVSCEVNDRKKLERLCRYVARPAIANERLKLSDCGQVVLTLKTPFRDGTTHVVMSPLELLQRLAALVPRSRLNLIRYHGVLAPNAKWRSQIVPSRPEPVGDEREGEGATFRGLVC